MKTLDCGRGRERGRELTYGSLEQVVRTARNPLSTGPGIQNPHDLVIIHHRHRPRTLHCLLFGSSLRADLKLEDRFGGCGWNRYSIHTIENTNIALRDSPFGFFFRTTNILVFDYHDLAAFWRFPVFDMPRASLK